MDQVSLNPSQKMEAVQKAQSREDRGIFRIVHLALICPCFVSSTMTLLIQQQKQKVLVYRQRSDIKSLGRFEQ